VVRAGFDGLRVYLAHFAGEPCVSVLVNGKAAGENAEVWGAMTRALGLPQTAAEGEAVATAPGAPRLVGTVQRSTGWELLLLLDEPAPGYAFVAAEESFGTNLLSVYIYLFGDGAPDTAAREEQVWQAWMQERYPGAKTTAGAA
jgi:hypothetical protein